MKQWLCIATLVVGAISCSKDNELEQSSIYGRWYLSTQDLIRTENGEVTVTTDTINDETIFYEFLENGKFHFQGGTGDYYLSNDSLYCKYANTSSSRYYGFKLSVTQDELVMRVTDTYPQLNRTTEQVNNYKKLY